MSAGVPTVLAPHCLSIGQCFLVTGCHKTLFHRIKQKRVTHFRAMEYAVAAADIALYNSSSCHKFSYG